MKVQWIYPAIACFLVVLQGCSSATIKVESNPPGAVVSLNNKEIGQTPLALKSSDYKEAFRMSFIELTVRAKGYEPRSFIAKTEGDQTVSITLNPYTEEYFANTLMANYQAQANKLIRDLLFIQGLLINKKYEQAEAALGDFIRQYPNIAATYVLRANIEISKNNRDLALRNLERAISIDPQDATAQRMMENLKKGG